MGESIDGREMDIMSHQKAVIPDCFTATSGRASTGRFHCITMYIMQISTQKTTTQTIFSVCLKPSIRSCISIEGKDYQKCASSAERSSMPCNMQLVIALDGARRKIITERIDA